MVDILVMSVVWTYFVRVRMCMNMSVVCVISPNSNENLKKKIKNKRIENAFGIIIIGLREKKNGPLEINNRAAFIL